MTLYGQVLLFIVAYVKVVGSALEPRLMLSWASFMIQQARKESCASGLAITHIVHLLSLLEQRLTNELKRTS